MPSKDRVYRRPLEKFLRQVLSAAEALNRVLVTEALVIDWDVREAFGVDGLAQLRVSLSLRVPIRAMSPITTLAVLSPLENRRRCRLRRRHGAVFMGGWNVYPFWFGLK